MIRLAGVALVVLAIVSACGGGEAVAPDPTIVFRAYAPFCGGIAYAATFSIDGALVGKDTFRTQSVNSHLQSRAFTVSPGRHVVGAKSDFLYVWPDTTVELRAGQVFTDTLNFYCS